MPFKPVTVQCPHCQQEIRSRHKAHLKRCPLSPENFARYRDAMTDVNAPGHQCKKSEYDAARIPGDMFDPKSLCALLKLTWSGVGRVYGLKPRQNRPSLPGAIMRPDRAALIFEQISAEIQAEIEAERQALLEESFHSGIKVVNVRSEVRNGRTYKCYMLR